ncbi:mechanosensitive ion channel family protein [filamentous cyanobacterium LEGE 11480]|uniref:Mechanosensitive ion channel family protein n=1 Tax=Romeriopsis navalis LEGE 11480 TaxID=2777977 RepID=A0A928Z450_9CYAN|nr:mechanosensitive ion channel family protein [Romeriopsis navalis]MBE9031384.1 mechanosensitive ion channel family protein [Romeriopsis navalis LEGE 11480]
MTEVLETVFSSLRELLGSSIKILPNLIMALVIIFITRYASQAVKQVAQRVAHRTFPHSSSLRLLVIKVSYMMTWVVGFVLAGVVGFPGLRLGDIIATLGLGSVAIGFAFQDIVKNFLAGILILVQNPFSIDDQIIIGDYEGVIEHVSFRTTQIRTYQGERIFIPNAVVFSSAVQVRTAYQHRRTDLAVGVDYSTPLKDAVEILHRSVGQVEGVLQNPEPEVDLIGFGDSSIDLVARYWTTPEQAQVRRTKTRAILAIKSAFDRASINIPFPIRTVYFHNQDNTESSVELDNNQQSSNGSRSLV